MSNLRLTDAATVKKILRQHGLQADKRLGQHFLISEKTLEKIVQGADLKPDDTVLEVGPGLGTLTVELARHCKKVIAVEKDRALLPILKETLAEQKNVELVHADILKLFPKYKIQDTKYKIVADLPYYLTSRFLRTFLESSVQPSVLVLLVQREVAERICARPPRLRAPKRYGVQAHMNLLAVAVQYYGKPEIVLRVPRGAFWPPPKVESALLNIRVAREYSPSDKTFFELVRLGFSSPRKQLMHNLSRKYPREVLKAAFLKTGVAEKARAENITLEKWLQLLNALR